MSDIVVVGAGISGAAIAYELAMAGVKLGRFGAARASAGALTLHG